MIAMSSNLAHGHETLLDRVLADAIAEKGHSRGSYAYFFTSQEGRLIPLPGVGETIEEYSGYIVTKDDEHFLFWLGWDQERQMPAMIHWDRIDPPHRWVQNSEYLDARASVGLPTNTRKASPT